MSVFNEPRINIIFTFETNTQISFEKLVDDKDYKFSRYNFFLTNYLLYKNKTIDAKKVIEDSRKEYNSNLLIKQTEIFLLNNKNEKIKNFFSCKNPQDPLAEFFYVIANLYSSEEDYRLSNFYLRKEKFLDKNLIIYNLLHSRTN